VSGPDIGASVRQRLLNKSRTQGRPFQELLQYFAMERSLYRLAKSPYSERFVLKGALLLTAWRAPQSRPTMDIDLEGQLNNQLGHIKEVVATVCEVDVEPDGIAFNRTSIEVSRIKEDADYEGVRVQFHATLARARIPMQLDIGFGDVITPEPTDIEYPSLLDFPAPVREIVEVFHSAVEETERRQRFQFLCNDGLFGIGAEALPVLSAAAAGNPFGLRWKPSGPWQ